VPFTSETARAAGSKRKRARIITHTLIAKLIEGGDVKLEALCDKLIERALDGDTKAIREILDRVEGKAPQTIVGDEENPVIVEHRTAREFIARRILGAAVEDRSREDPVQHDG
jgi:hypothetical protein